MGMIRFFFFKILLLAFWVQAEAQVLADEHLRQSHQGTLEQSINYPDKGLGFEFDFLKEESKVKKQYDLKLYQGEKLLGSYPVRVRNLIITCYFEVKLKDKNGTIKTLTAVYDKGNKWLRIKFAPQPDCSRPEAKWRRVNRIQSFDEILSHIIIQMDGNLILDCYVE